MLTDPDANLGDDARAALAKLDRDTCAGLSQRLGTNVNKKLEEMIETYPEQDSENRRSGMRRIPMASEARER